MPKHTNEEKALAALLNCNSVRAASKESKLSEATLYRYLSDQEFVAKYRKARRDTVESAVARVQQMMHKAADTFERNLNCENSAVEVRTAQIIFENGLKGVEVADILERLENLENANKV